VHSDTFLGRFDGVSTRKNGLNIFHALHDAKSGVDHLSILFNLDRYDHLRTRRREDQFLMKRISKFGGLTTRSRLTESRIKGGFGSCVWASVASAWMVFPVFFYVLYTLFVMVTEISVNSTNSRTVHSP
jgi:hypothetical protein